MASPSGSGPSPCRRSRRGSSRSDERIFRPRLETWVAGPILVYMQNDTTHAVAHDTVLLDLLVAQGTAATNLDIARERVAHAVVVRVTHTYDAHWSENGMPEGCHADNLDEGTLVLQSQTFTRGEGGFYVTGEPGNYRRNRRRVSTFEAAEIARKALAGTAQPDYVVRAGERLDEATIAVEEAREAVIAHEENYTGWSRFFLVTSSAGHVHSSMHCSTCTPTTTFAPVVALSGQDEAAAVEMLGSTLCTVCFPSAPVEGKVKKVTKAQAAKLLK